MIATARFDVTRWDPAVYDQRPDGPDLARVAIDKTYAGDLVAESTGEGLFCALGDPGGGAGYVVCERVVGRLGARRGSFVLQHGGVMEPDGEGRTFGHVVPGSGTGDLYGLQGTVTIGQADGGGHTLTLDYTLDGLAPV